MSRRHVTCWLVLLASGCSMMDLDESRLHWSDSSVDTVGDHDVVDDGPSDAVDDTGIDPGDDTQSDTGGDGIDDPAEDDAPVENACGGTAGLPHEPGEDCGDCLEYACDGLDAVVCETTCPTGHFCEGPSDVCSLCDQDEHCGTDCAPCLDPTPHCLEGTDCVECLDRSDCEAWEACTDNDCVACTSEADCLGWECHEQSGRCTDGPVFLTGESVAAVIGQDDFTSCTGNRGSSCAPNSLHTPFDVCGNGNRIAVTDVINNRVALYDHFPAIAGPEVDVVLGQVDATTVDHPAMQSASTVDIPRGVWTDGTAVVVADTGNHRVLIWHSWPTAHGQAADVVLGHGTTPGTMFSRNGRNDGESYPTDAVFSEPTGVYYSAYYTVLLVADSDNHRVLVFDAELSAIASGRAADHVIGQSGMYAGDANRGGDVDRFCFDTPTDVALVRDAVSGDSRIFVADSGNNRVLVFEDYLFDSNGPPAQHVIGQTSMTLTTAPEPPNAATLEQPWAVWSDGTIVAVSDMGNHRVLVYDAIPTADGVSASSVLGQATMAGCSPSCGGSSLENPRGIVFDSLGIWVADTSNNRVVLFP